MKYSIVITTYNHLEDCLKPCINSIIKYTDFTDTEVIVVANGCTDGTKEYVESLGNPFKLVWFNDAIGYTQAANAGFSNSIGEFVVLLNNDTQLLDQRKNEWLGLLNKPFTTIPGVAITGPLMNFDQNSKRNFIVFFCAMIWRGAYNKVGKLDEIFSPGFGEDTDWCIRAEEEGFKCIQVPTAEKPTHGTGRLMIGQFPIYHYGEATFEKIPDKFSDLVNRNSKILADRYAKQLPPGYFSKMDQDVYRSFVGRQKNGSKIAEIGVWKGRSLCSVADIIRDKNLSVIAIDTFSGTKDEGWGLEQEAANAHIQEIFELGLEKFGIRDMVTVINGDSTDVSNRFPDSHFSCVFIDADHSYEGCSKDLNSWWHKVEPGGILCGHDYLWPNVHNALIDRFGEDRIHTDTNNMWYVTKPRIYDCFMFANELDILEIRMNELKDVVYKFVIVEAPMSQSGLQKPLHLKNNIDRFDKDKIIHIVLDDMPSGADPWEKERFQRDAVVRGLTDLTDDDIIIISDADEIPRASAVRDYRVQYGIVTLRQQMSYYYVNYVSREPWEWLKILPYSMFKNMTACQVRYEPHHSIVDNGGWHFSFLGGTEKIIEKIKCYAHQEFNRPDILDPVRIEKLVDEGKDIFGRPGVEYVLSPIDSTYPLYLRQNMEKFSKLIRPCDGKVEVTAIISTKDRYFTSLPGCLLSIALQTRKPEYLIIYDDGECRDLREEAIYKNIFSLLSLNNIKWEVRYGQKIGQVANHQHSINTSTTEWIWRIDDDTVMEPTVLENLIKNIKHDVAAVAGLVIDPKTPMWDSKIASNKIEDIYLGANIQWFKATQKQEVDHLYSTFIYRKSASGHGYQMDLSRVGHREETMFTYEMKRAGWKLIVDPSAITWHLRNDTGGIRSDSHRDMWHHDEEIFTRKMKQWGIKPRDMKMIVLDSGIGDHYAFKNLIPELKNKYKDIVMAVCYPEIFEDTGLKLISIGDARQSMDIDRFNVYRHMWDNTEKHWTLEQAYRSLYGI